MYLKSLNKLKIASSDKNLRFLPYSESPSTFFSSSKYFFSMRANSVAILLCISLGVDSKKLPFLSFFAYLLIQVVAASSSPLKYSKALSNTSLCVNIFGKTNCSAIFLNFFSKLIIEILKLIIIKPNSSFTSIS